MQCNYSNYLVSISRTDLEQRWEESCFEVVAVSFSNFHPIISENGVVLTRSHPDWRAAHDKKWSVFHPSLPTFPHSHSADQGGLDGWLLSVPNISNVFSRPTIWPIDCQIETDGNDIITRRTTERELKLSLIQLSGLQVWTGYYNLMYW